jgi:DNA-binding FadR family transcriptional regulator
MVDVLSDRPLYRQVADELRRRIVAHELPPGSYLPSEDELAREAGVHKATVRHALALLRGEGLVVTVRGQRTLVRQLHATDFVPVPSGAVMAARMPTPAERAEFRLPDGVPMLVVRTGDDTMAYPADRVELTSA